MIFMRNHTYSQRHCNMDESSLRNYNAFDSCETLENTNDIVRVVLDEQKHFLSEEDKKILRDREDLRNELHTLQNANPVDATEVAHLELWNPPASQVPTTAASKSDVYFVDVEAIEQPTLTLENVEPNNAEIDATIANFIQDDDVKAEVLRLNEQIEINSLSIRTLSNEAKTLLVEKLNFKRKLANIERKIVSFSSEDAKVKRIKRKRGADCADTGHQKRTYFYRFGAPYFKSRERFPADHNPDLTEIIRTDQPMMLRLPRIKRFLPHDATFLEHNVLKQLKAKRIHQLRACLKQVEDRRKRERANGDLAEEIRCIERTIRETQAVAQISATTEWNIPVDFMSLPTSFRFTTEEYERIWRLTGDPSLSRAEFSEHEVAELKALVEKYSRQNWDRIASEMSTRRSGFMCFTKYVTTEKKGKNVPWTKDENELLYNLCISLDFVTKSDSRYQYWKSIRRHFPHRTYSQIHSHWTYVLEPRLKKGRFTADEHRLMVSLVRQGKSYREIAQLVRNRTCVQIRSHFEMLSAAKHTQLNRGNWTADEENSLLQLVAKYGTHDWVKISEELGTRNRSQCRLKYMLFRRNDHRFSKGTRLPKEYWSEEENEQFKELVRKYGADFSKMSEEMPSKTRNQLRHKYHRCKNLDEFRLLIHESTSTSTTPQPPPPKQQHRVWTDDELEQFKQLLMEYGAQYKKISALMPNKSPIQLRYKYYSMKNVWNLSLPAVTPDLSDVAENRLKKSRSRKRKKSVAVVPPEAVTVCGNKPPAAEQQQHLPLELFENFITLSHARQKSYDPLPVAVVETPPVPAAVPRTPPSSVVADDKSAGDNRQLAAPASKSSKQNPKTIWTVDEVEQFKQLLMLYGPQHKKISEMIPGKTHTQLRSKYRLVMKKWNLPLPPANAVSADNRRDAKPTPKARKRRKSSPPSLPEPVLPDNVLRNLLSSSGEGVAPADNTGRGSAKPVAKKRRKTSPDVLPKSTTRQNELQNGPSLCAETPLGDRCSDAAAKLKTRKRKPTSLATVRLPVAYGSEFCGLPLPAVEVASVDTSSDDTSKPKSKRRRKASCPSKLVSLRSELRNPPLSLADAATSGKRSRDTAKPRAKKCGKAAAAAFSEPVASHSDELLTAQYQEPLPVELFKNVSASSEVRSSSISSLTNLKDGFAGFPDQGELLPLSYQELVPIDRTRAVERAQAPGLLCEQMIVPEQFSEIPVEMNEITVDARCNPNEQPVVPAENASGDVKDESVTNDAVAGRGESISCEVVGSRYESACEDGVKEEKKEEFSS